MKPPSLIVFVVVPLACVGSCLAALHDRDAESLLMIIVAWLVLIFGEIKSA